MTNAQPSFPYKAAMPRAQAEVAALEINAHLTTRGPIALNGAPAAEWGVRTVRACKGLNRWGIQADFHGGYEDRVSWTWLNDTSLAIITAAMQAPAPGAPLAAPAVTGSHQHVCPRCFSHGVHAPEGPCAIPESTLCSWCAPWPDPDPQTPAAREAAQRADEAELPYVCGRCYTGLSFEYADRFELDEPLLCGVCRTIDQRAALDDAEPCYRCHQRGGAKVYAQDMGYRHVTCPAARADEAELQAGLLATLPPMAGGSGEANQLMALTNQNRRYRIVQQYLVTALEAAEAHLVADFSAGNVAYLKTRRALNVACEQARDRLTRLDPANMPPDEGTPAGDAARWLANRGLPPMAGGAPSHYDDPAWYADEAWALQEERNAESAQEAAEAEDEHTHFCPTCHQARPCTGTGCADGPRECATCSQCRGW